MIHDLCFDENTKIDMKYGISKRITNIQLYNETKTGIVLGIIRFPNSHSVIYNYKGVIVTGNHLVFENNKWIRIKNSQLSKRVFGQYNIFCLITTDNNIYVNGIKFRDYLECNDLDIRQIINYGVVKNCNNNIGYIKTDNDLQHNYYWGFGGDTIIKVDNTYMKIKDIVNNRITNDNILGHIKISGEEIRMYNVNGIKVSGNTLIHYNRCLWERVHQYDKSIEINERKVVYNLITRDNLIVVIGMDKDYIFRDFKEYNNSNLEEEIEKIIEDRLNIMDNY